MKSLALPLLALCLVSIATPALAAENVHDRSAMVQLTVIEAQTSMLGLCGVTGDAADKILARDKEKAAQVAATLSDEGKKALPARLAQLDAGVKASWEKTPEATRTASCAKLKESMAKSAE